MIIGISGKANSGKDTVGKIIQYLTNPFDKNVGTTFNVNDDYGANNSWKIKKFADKLKDMVCLLLYCTREQLESREFKEKELGEEWTRTFNSDYELIENRLFNPEIGDFQETLTVRKLLQEVGTEAMRNVVHPSIWVNALMSEYKVPSLPDETTFSVDDTQWIKDRTPNWVITDMRFPNEMKAVETRGGITIRVNRNRPQLVSIQADEISEKRHNELRELFVGKEHPSETALDNATFDYVINNNGTIEELIEQVKEILIKEKII